MNAVPSQDQVMAQLRILIPAVCTALTAFGVSSTQAGSYQQIALASLAPISYVVVAIWSVIANTQKSQIAKVTAMPGVEKVLVNAQANSTLATEAVNPANTKVEAVPEAKAQVTATANAAS